MVALADLPEIIPILYIEGLVMYPGIDIKFGATNEDTRRVIKHVKSTDANIVGLVNKNYVNDEYYKVGCAVKIEEVTEKPDFLDIQMNGFSRFRLVDTFEGFLPIVRGSVKWDEFEQDLNRCKSIENFDKQNFIGFAKRHFKSLKSEIDLDEMNAPDEFLIDFVAIFGGFSTAERQALLEQKTLLDRQEAIITLIKFECAESKFKPLQDQ